MRISNCLAMLAILLWIVPTKIEAQDSSNTDIVSRVAGLPDRLLAKINKKTASLERQLTKQTERYLQKLSKSESKLRRKLYRFDSTAAKDFLSFDAVGKYELLQQKLNNDSVASGISTGEYRAYIDSLKGILAFLDKNPSFVSSSAIIPANISGSLQHFRQLEGKLQTAEFIKQFIQQRREQIKTYLLRYSKLPTGISSIYQDYSRQAYYYSRQVNEYKNILNDPDKMVKTALALLNKLPVFNAFMSKYSVLAGLFPSQGGSYDPTTPVQGLATRAQMNAFMQEQLGTAGSMPLARVQQNIQSAQGQLDEWRNKLNANGGGELDMPDFKPNTQKEKSFFKRLEYGTNLQTVRGNYFFPITTDLGLSVGYKLNDKNRIGLGASYKTGWGQDFKHISVSNQGMSLRSFVDINLEKSFFLSGGFEYNYQQPFQSLDVVRQLDNWQKSGLVGISKIVSLKTKLFKKTKIQLLWDFISYQQVPRAQPFKFRVGYAF